MNSINTSAGNPVTAVAGDPSASVPTVAPAAEAGADAAYKAKATEAAIKFEGFFIAHMLHQMRSGTRELSAEDSVFKDQVNSDMLDMADTLVADKMAGQRAFGVADAILRQLLPASPVAPASHARVSTAAAAASSAIK
ncbi:flagellar biosynthesis protein FlgJ [Undibacterium sp.]|jgi:flagellar protein FlgJ|uniref:flagellar biosynthesis protein FlgJ n=1 Tax=Undibacterium sp. TaxID=1914977 RepID=UPI002C33CFF2|nr:flagellar biosynthesis protein FlgJ [Undibacterium sp.]HTD04146.1 flagellar biosynthesis protein FlgJ [Undibacterium sp.]